MNKLNYASLSASKKLVDNGIVLETEKTWFFRNTGWEMVDRYAAHHVNRHYLPAPSMAEVWRELPECIPYDDTTWAAWQAHKQGDLTIISIAAFRKEFISLNPTDALIDLLIHVRNLLHKEE